jgi:hypothetical protein
VLHKPLQASNALLLMLLLLLLLLVLFLLCCCCCCWSRTTCCIMVTSIYLGQESMRGVQAEAVLHLFAAAQLLTNMSGPASVYALADGVPASRTPTVAASTTCDMGV